MKASSCDHPSAGDSTEEQVESLAFELSQLHCMGLTLFKNSNKIHVDYSCLKILQLGKKYETEIRIPLNV